MRDYLKSIKVDKSVKPIHYSKRKLFDLIVGEYYYVSFGSNNVTRCKLIEMDEQGITIEYKTKPSSKNGYIDANGNISHDWKSIHHLKKDEIGRTPEEAVINTVTF